MKLFRILLIIGMFAFAAFAWKHLPDTVPIHWNFAGQADDWANKDFAVWLFPGITLLCLIFFPLFRSIDPRNENYKKFSKAWEWIQTLIITLFAYFFFVQMYVSLQPEKSVLMPQLMLGGLGVLFIFMGNWMGKIRQNYFVGIKTPWTLADDEVWRRTHRLGGWLFIFAGLIFVAEIWLNTWVPHVFLLSIAIVVIVPLVYSFAISKRNTSPWILTLFIVIVSALTIIGLRIASGEDTWICENGEWVAHGNPSSEKPTVPCP